MEAESTSTTNEAEASAQQQGWPAERNSAVSGGTIPPLTSEQELAVGEFERPVLVVSPPGNGKTTVVTAKYANAVARWGHGAAMAVTFTTKAASEVQTRLAAMGCDPSWSAGDRPGKAGALTVGTFHAIGLRLLTMSAHLGHYDGATVLAATDDLDQIVFDADTDRSTSDKRALSERTRALKKVISQVKNKGVLATPEGYASIDGTISGMVPGLPNPGSLTYAKMVAYQQTLRQQGLLDFDDCLIQATLMVRQHRQALLPSLRALIVDEYQDVNDLNEKLIAALSDGISLTCCGDADQAIYGWRNAKVEHIQEFVASHPGALQVVLTTNYRSVPGIMAMAERVMTGIRGRVAKTTEKQQADDQAKAAPLTFHPYRSRCAVYNPMSRGYEEGLAAYTAATCRSIMEKGRRPSDLIVLTRTNEQATVVKSALIDVGVRARVNNPSALDSPELRSLVSWLKLLCQPWAEGPVAQLSSLSLRSKPLHDLASMSRLQRTTLMELMAERHRTGRLRHPRLVSVVQSYKDIQDLQHACDEATLVGRIGEIIMASPLRSSDEEKASHFWNAYASILPGLQDGTGLLRAVETLQAGLSADDLAWAGETVEVSTVHSVKGRQKPIVVISAMADGIMPTRMAAAAGLKSREMDEERRLAYVALSRAREEIHLIEVDGAKSVLIDLLRQDAPTAS